MVRPSRQLTIVRLILATACLTTAIRISGHDGFASTIGVPALVLVGVWAVVDEAVLRVQTALRRAFAGDDGERGEVGLDDDDDAGGTSIVEV